MLVNADFSRRATVAPGQYRWVRSPQGGVERAMLDRVGGEAARATSIVRYAPGSCFPRHHHPGGEEILVLSGTFCEDGERYPAGWYLRNPPGSVHRPSSPEGAVIFVKLRQMQPAETARVRIDTNAASSWRHGAEGDTCPLFSGATELVCLHRLAAGQRLSTRFDNGAEVFVIAGRVRVASTEYECGSWLRLPPGDRPAIAADPGGATLYVKTGHLRDMAEKEHVCEW
jgi:quercetin dioxygenase-like cupin family protein